jgi:sterol desaturase/sphingolipid hydroxylase (fatty acid hydroxylase superfamily)
VAHDLALFVVNALLYSFLFVGPLQMITGTVGTFVWANLHAMLGPLSTPWSGPAAVVGLTVAVFVVADFAFFVAHLLLHKIRWLWPFHEVHHSAPVLVPFTVFRRHPVDVVFDAAIAGALLGVVYGVAGYLGGEALQPATIFGVNVLLFVGLLAGFNLQHSHVWLSFGPLDGVFISPATHQIHHSTAPEHLDRNFGNLLAIWDRIAGTLVRPEPRGSVEFGLSGGATDEYRTLGRLLLLPFARATRALVRRR